MSMTLTNRCDSLLLNAPNVVQRNAHRGDDAVRNAFRPDSEPGIGQDDGPI